MSMRSIAGRLALMFGLAVTLVSAIGGVALYAFQAAELRRHKREEIEARFAMPAKMMQDTTPVKWPLLARKLADISAADGSLVFLVESPDPRYRIGSRFLDGAQWLGPAEGFSRARTDERKYLTLARTFPADRSLPQRRLILASSTKYVESTAAGLAAGIFIFSLLGIGAVSALGWWIARRALAPVDHLSEHARLLGSDNLSLRLPTGKLPAELAGMVLSLNDALDRLQESYQRLSTFNADVAHELRTPLANLIGETQVVLSRPRASPELEEVLQSNLEELERLRRIINDMLFLARADQGEVASNRVRVELAAETRKNVDFMEVVLDEAGVSVEIKGDAEAQIERALYGRAITNLLDNAVRHGMTPGRITVRIAEEAEAISIGVFNPGSQIGIEHLDRIFDRFYRIDPARLNSHDSHGFGLAIVKAVAQMHGGSVFARNEAAGVCIGFTIAHCR